MGTKVVVGGGKGTTDVQNQFYVNYELAFFLPRLTKLLD